MYDKFFSQAQELLAQGIPFATAIVVRAENPTSGKPGHKAIILPNGVMHGWIGGSCAQPTVIKEARQALAEREPRLIRLSTTPSGDLEREGLIDLPMTCYSGGTLEIYIEPQFPLPRLMVVGNLPLAQALVQLGKMMNYHVIAVDPDNEGAGLAEADEVVTALAEIPPKITSLTYVVVASHGQYDEAALALALRPQAAYIALVASRRRAESVLANLSGQGLTEADLSKLKYPAGLNIQAKRGDEIALSIMAEIVQTRRAERLDLENLLAELDLSGTPDQAIDPVCGMAVKIKGAVHTTRYQEQLYYFCGQSCKMTFLADPKLSTFVISGSTLKKLREPPSNLPISPGDICQPSIHQPPIYQSGPKQDHSGWLAPHKRQ